MSAHTTDHHEPEQTPEEPLKWVRTVLRHEALEAG